MKNRLTDANSQHSHVLFHKFIYKFYNVDPKSCLCSTTEPRVITKNWFYEKNVAVKSRELLMPVNELGSTPSPHH